MITSLKFENNKWFFTDAVVAKNFAELSLFFTQNFGSSKFNVIMNFHFAEAVRIAIEKKFLDLKDIYLTDLELLEKIENCKDEDGQMMLMQCKNPEMKISKEGFVIKNFLSL
ncbi:MAG: hypothetical protein LBD32_01820 [Cytophagales bacterium]|jgi:hypothetical protein|nr:hypothetical protein [Cytophagales bacterium]